MKKFLFFLSVVFFTCPVIVKGAVELNGIFYNLDDNLKIAEVTANPSYYSGDIVIPDHINYTGNQYIVTTIGRDAFRNCTDLNTIVIPNSIKTIASNAFRSCEKLKSISIPNSVSYIGGSAFSSCSSLESITLPNNIQIIRNATFSGCSSLKSIEVPDNILTIESFAFSSNGLNQIILGGNLKTIENGAFQDCLELENVYCYTSEIPTADVNAFVNSTMNATLHVPSNLIATYKQTIPWKDFKFIEDLKEGDPCPPTSIKSVRNRKMDQKYYDLRGKQVDKPSKGINIKNGVKIIVK